MKVDLFIPCFVDQLFPQTAFNMVKVLEKACCDVRYNTNQTCCGQPAFNAGFWDDARKVANKFLHDFEAADYIVAPSASCVGFVRNYYGRLFEGRPEAASVHMLGKKIYEFTEFITEVVQIDQYGAVVEGKATYHDSCAALRECRIRQGPRTLLSNVKGLQLQEMKETETCCGFGGSFAIKFDAISIAMAEQKVQHAMATGAEYMISTDLSCLMHLDGYIQKQQLPLRTMHIADVLASGWEE